MSKFNVGDKVRYIGKDHTEMTEFYPEIGTIGTVVKESGDRNWYIQWPKGSTSRKDCWYCDENDIELVIEDMTNEEIWEMLRPKMLKNDSLCENYRIGSCAFVPTYDCDAVHNAIATAYKSGYFRAMKGRPFKIGEKKAKKQGGHWEPVNPKNLPKEGTEVRYSRKFDDNSYSTFENRTNMKIGEETVVMYDNFGAFGIKPIHGTKEWWCSFSYPDRFDMWVEDDK